MTLPWLTDLVQLRGGDLAQLLICRTDISVSYAPADNHTNKVISSARFLFISYKYDWRMNFKKLDNDDQQNFVYYTRSAWYMILSGQTRKERKVILCQLGSVFRVVKGKKWWQFLSVVNSIYIFLSHSFSFQDKKF